MNVKEMRQWLKQFPDETIVTVIIRVPGGSYEGDYYRQEPLRPEQYENWDYTDFVGNVWVKPDSSHFGKKILTLGEN